MYKIVTIHRGQGKQEEKEEVKVHYDKVGDYWEVTTIPQNLILEDSIAEMLEDIGEWRLEYLKEVLGDNCTFGATSL